MSTVSRLLLVLTAPMVAAHFGLAGVHLVGVQSLLAQPPQAAAALLAEDVPTERRPPEELPEGQAMAGWLGVVLDDDFAPHGVRIVAIAPRSPAAKAGLRPGDLIRRLTATIPGDATEGNVPTHDVPAHEFTPRDALDISAWIGDHQAGDAITLTILRRGVLIELTAALGTRPTGRPDINAPPHTPSGPLPLPFTAADRQERAKFAPRQAWLGVETAPVTNRARRFYHLPSNKGAVVSRVYAGSPAERAGIQPGTVIRAIDSREVTNPHDVARFIAEAGVGRRVEISLWADDRPVWLYVRLDGPPLD